MGPAAHSFEGSVGLGMSVLYMGLGMSVLQGPRGRRFLMDEVPRGRKGMYGGHVGFDLFVGTSLIRKHPPPIGLPKKPRHRPTVGS